MRLTPAEQKSLHDASVRWFGVPPRLFGSRADDAQRGGDIDLYIEVDLPPQDAFQRETQMAAELYQTLGERKIDIVVNTGRLDLPIYRVARERGVWL